MKELVLSISEAAKKLQVESHVLRYWEDELDIQIPRNDMGHRLYGPKEMKLLYSIKELKRQGFQLRAIKLLLHDLKSGEELDLDKLIAMREEINRRVEFLNEEGIEVEESLPELIRKSLIQKQLKAPDKEIPHFQINDEGKVTRLPVRKDKQENTAKRNHSVYYEDHSYDDSLQKNSMLPKSGLLQKDPILQDGLQRKEKAEGLSQERIQQFQYIMIRIMNQALQDHTDRMTEELKQTLSVQLSHDFMENLAKQVATQLDGKMVSSMSEQIAMSVEQTLGDHISDDVSTRIMKEMNYLSRMQEEQEEAHYQKLDELLRNKQEQGNQKVHGFQKRKLKKQEKKQQKLERRKTLEDDEQMIAAASENR